MIIPLILAIIAMVDPVAITWLIIAVIIYAVNRVVGRTVAHIIQEGKERITPSLSDFNTTPAVISIITGIGIMAALDHARPNIVFSRLAFAVRCFSATCRTIAARGLPLQVRRLYLYCMTAVT